jgi:hypothetical protein
MFLIRRIPPSLDKFLRPLHGYFHGNPGMYCRLLVVTIAVMWGWRNVANLSRSFSRADGSRGDPPPESPGAASGPALAARGNRLSDPRWCEDNQTGQGDGRHRQDERPHDRHIQAGGLLCLRHPSLPSPCDPVGYPALCQERAGRRRERSL